MPVDRSSCVDELSTLGGRLFGIHRYSTVSILVCFMLCWRIKYDDDGDEVNSSLRG